MFYFYDMSQQQCIVLLAPIFIGIRGQPHYLLVSPARL